MSTYQPISRRPIAGSFRLTAHRAVDICVRANIHPDTISYLSIVAAAAAGACFLFAGRWPWLLLAGPLLCYARLWCNMLDGMVALAGGKASSRGEILNDLPDRISDVLIFAGVAHSGLCIQAMAYWAAIMALMTAYVGIFGQAVRAQREYSGIMSKPWRMVVLHLGAWVTFGMILYGRSSGSLGGLTIIDWTCIVVIAGCLQTLWIRLARILRALRTRPTA